MLFAVFYNGPLQFMSINPVDDTVLGNGNTIGNPHSLSYKVWEIQTKIVKPYGKSVKISKKYFLLSEIQRKKKKIKHI